MTSNFDLESIDFGVDEAQVVAGTVLTEQKESFYALLVRMEAIQSCQPDDKGVINTFFSVFDWWT